MALTDNQINYFLSLPQDRQRKWLKDSGSYPNEINRQLNIDESTSQSIYNPDFLTNDKEIEFITCNELLKKEFPPQRWVVDKLIPKNGITCISGKPKIGKSLLTINLSLCIASGRKLFGEFTVEQASVLLISKEDPPRLIQERLNAFGADSSTPIYLCLNPNLYLDNSETVEIIRNKVIEKQVKVVIIDSFRRIFKGEENSSQVIADVQKNFKLILGETTSIVFVHHHGKENFFQKKNLAEKLRGSSDILAMLDSLLIIERIDYETIKITQEVLRQDKPLQPFIIHIPNFENGETSFEIKGYTEVEKEKIELAENAILTLLSSENELNQSQIIQKLITLNHRPTTLKNALKKLVELKKLSYIKVGKQNIYTLASNNHPLNHQVLQNEFLTSQPQENAIGILCENGQHEFIQKVDQFDRLRWHECKKCKISQECECSEEEFNYRLHEARKNE